MRSIIIIFICSIYQWFLLIITHCKITTVLIGKNSNAATLEL